MSQSFQKLGPEQTSYMVTGVQEEILYCSRTSSGKQKKARSIS